jgi:MFS family permease
MTAGVPAPAPPAGIVLADGYVLPPPPTTGAAWRDQNTLVMTKDASLPDRCVKCNAPANGTRVKRKLSWHHPAIYLVILVAWIIYLVLAITLSKRATVFVGLCAEHYQRRRKLMIVGWVMLAIGLITPFLAFANDYPGVGVLGLLLFLASAIFLVMVARIVKVKKIDDRFVWLTGIDSNYLAQFTPLQPQV